MITCQQCGHWHGGVGTEPGNPCTHYVERLKAECGCTYMRTGLDDGPPLPSQRARDAAYRRIMATQPRTDAQRINWIEAKKYVTIGIGHDGTRFAYEVRINEGGLKRFFGRSLRAAVDSGMLPEDAAIEPMSEPEPVEYAKVKLAMDQISSAVKRHGLMLVVDIDGNYDVVPNA
jgi:hypothetical protein